MFEEFDRDSNLVIICDENKIIYFNETAAAHFGCYGFAAENKDLNSVFSEDSIKIINEKSAGGEESSALLTFLNKAETEFSVSKTGVRNKYVLLRSKHPPESAEYAQIPDDSVNTGENAQKKYIETIFSDIAYLKNAAMIRRNNDFYYRLVEIEQCVGKIIKDRGAQIIKASPNEAEYALKPQTFDICRLLEKLISRVRGLLLSENYNITVVEDYRVTGYIRADYLLVAKAITALLSNSIKYLLASGRKGRLDISVIGARNNRLVILIKDNGVGVSEGTFEMLNKSAKLYSVLPDVKDNKSFDIDIGTIASWLERNGGVLTVRNSGKKGSETELVFPAALEASDYIYEQEYDSQIRELVLLMFKSVLGR